jgi:flagellar motor switch protein FliM
VRHLAGRIELNLPAIEKPALAEGEAEEAGADTEFKPAPGSHPPKGTWVITVTVSESPAAPAASSGSRSTSI